LLVATADGDGRDIGAGIIFESDACGGHEHDNEIEIESGDGKVQKNDSGAFESLDGGDLFRDDFEAHEYEIDDTDEDGDAGVGITELFAHGRHGEEVCGHQDCADGEEGEGESKSEFEIGHLAVKVR